MIDRRTLLQIMAAISNGGGLFASGQAMSQTLTRMTQDEATLLAIDGHDRLLTVAGMQMHGREQIAILLYPGFTALDVVAPHYFLACLMGATVHLVATMGNDLGPVTSDLGLAIAPTIRLADCPTTLDLVFVPGGTDGTVSAMDHHPTLDFLKAASASGALMTSVCTGSFVLASAGFLQDRRATSHWVAREALSAFGAVPVDARVVTDGRIITGAGVSAGLDLGLAVIEALRGRPYAATLMLQAEYAPQPPFAGGTLATTDPVIAEAMQGMFTPFVENIATVASKLR